MAMPPTLGIWGQDPTKLPAAVGEAATTGVFPWASAGAAAAYPLLQTLFPKAFGGQKEGVNPAKYKDDLVIDDQDLSGIRANLKKGAAKSAGKVISSIKQVGAANRMPVAATQTQIGEVGTNIAEGLATAEPGLQDLKRRSLSDYLDRLNQFKGIENENTANVAGGNQNALSSLARIFDMWRSGSFNKEPIPDINTG